MQINTYRELLDFIRRNRLWQKLAVPPQDETDQALRDMQWYAHTAFLDILLDNPELRAIAVAQYRETWPGGAEHDEDHCDLYEMLFEDTATRSIYDKELGDYVLYTEDWPGDIPA